MKNILLFSLLYIFWQHSIFSNVLLQSPTLLSASELQELEDEWHTTFNFHSKNKLISISLCYHNTKAGFAIKFLKIPIYSYHYKYLPDIAEIKQLFQGSFPAYFFSNPLQLEHATPKHIDQKELVNIIKNKKVIFYTGAGISAGKVATMSDLERSLKFKKGFRYFLKTAWNNPKKITDAFFAFCRTAISSSPTEAHYALKHLAEYKNTMIITENVDLLQHKTGIKPLFAYSSTLHSITKNQLQEIDYVVCIGLSHDDRGFLAWYKEHNPQGKILAIDLKQPVYLANQDLFCQGDLQKALPEVAKKFKKA